MNENFIDVDQDLRDFLNDIIHQTSQWRVRIENIQRNSLIKGLKICLLCKILDKVNDLFELCSKNQLS